MDIRPIDIGDDDELRAFYDVRRRARLLGRETAPHNTFQESAGEVRGAKSSSRRHHLGAWVDDVLVGVAELELPVLDNTDKAYFEVFVDPAHQRRGYGSLLLDDVLGRCRAEGRGLAMGELTVPIAQRDDHGYRRFAERHGFELANAEVVRWQQLPVPEQTIQEWADYAASIAAGYTIETYVDDFPDDLLPSLCLLLGQLAVDAPTGSVDFEEESMTPDLFREMRAMQRAQGRTVFETVAVTPDRVVAAQTTLNVPPAPSRDALQWGTFVHREHRGHRLGLAVKAANLREVQKRHPDLRRVVTQNAETNDYMVSINELMGFEPVELSVEMVINL